ncbi:polysaccharide pyruvyl transferase family protein [Lysobacter enzymogenes]|uniref:polysaccharide pyruvyl transferase family protein n=1 Tax=Lysobacter enzymogenes TaxID=69 RepID=UPI0008983F54|nr:polysaccharide pyruvyl transferase family protein [Lysobacter enzymogenes]SDW35031.1 Polysaccharide pyruvyl transferase [Lysobacter enzymogenes]
MRSDELNPNPQAFLYGIAASVRDSALLDTAQCFRRVGENTGNLAFHYAIRRQLGLRRRVGWGACAARVDAAGKVAVLPCANQVGDHIDMAAIAERMAATRPAIVALGLGVQAGAEMGMPEVPAGTLTWLRLLADRAPGSAPNISVRGEFSRRVLESLGFGDRVVTLGCPSLFLNPDRQLGRAIELRYVEPKRICVVSGHYQWTGLSRIEASLAAIAAQTGGSCVMQSPLEMVALGRGDAGSVPESELAACRDFCAPHLDIEQFREWCSRHALSFFDVCAWMEHFRRYDLVIGTRIHGVMLALQAGIPAICIPHDSRTLELCEVMRVPYVPADQIIDGVSRTQLSSLWRFDGAMFDRNRAELAQRYRDFLHGNGLSDLGLLRQEGGRGELGVAGLGKSGSEPAE